jgi:multiple sugar transport system substrate-binding protein
VRARRVAGAALVLALGATTVACTDGSDPESGPGGGETSATPSPTQVANPITLTFGVWGSDAEVAAYQSVVDAYDAKTPEAEVRLKRYESRAELTGAVGTDKAPDVFLINRGDLAGLRDAEQIQPVGDLLDERDVEFGDGYYRPALEAFSSDRELQCMPYGISPMVIYYNKALVDFDKMANRDLETPDFPEDPGKAPTWDYDQFTAAVQFASRPRRGVAGLYVAPTLRGLAPYIYSAGGSLFDDPAAPTSLAFSSDGTRDALDQVLPLLRDPKETLTAEQLSEKPALDWFEDGKLAMIAGFRDLTPQLRQVEGLDFDVLPMPNIGGATTVGDMTGLCMAAGTPDVAESADFLADFVSTESVSEVAATGYLTPANTQVALSDAFVEPGQLPEHANVFTDSIRDVQLAPLLDDYPALEAAVAGPLDQLLEAPVLDLEAITTEIDEASQTVLTPPETEEDPESSPSPDE